MKDPLAAVPWTGVAPIDDCWRHIGVQGDGSCERLSRVVHCRNCTVYARAAERLLAREATFEESVDAAGETAMPLNAFASYASGASGFLVFRIGGEWLGLSAAAVARVVPRSLIRDLPHQRGQLAPGLANVDGTLLLALNLARLLGIESRDPARGRFIVFEHAASRTVLGVDEVFDVVAVTQMSRLPATVSQALQHFSFATTAWQGHTVGLLDAERLYEGILRNLG